MINGQFSINDKCQTCNHLGFCQTYWGEACKRQGGDRQPRLKSSQVKQSLSEKKQKTVKPDKLHKSKRSMSQPITTRRVNWDLTS